MSTRAQSTVIGVVLLFGIAIIAFSSYQAVQIPDQNAQIEYQHFQDVQNDLIAVRSGIAEAGQADVSQYRTVQLGTNYPTRILGLNPPDPAGALTTSEPHNITIEDENGDRVTLSTRFLEYHNEYNQLTVGTIRYENSVLYLDERNTSGEIVVLEDQNLLTGGSSVRVTALHNDVTRRSTGRVTLELYPVDTPDRNLTGLSGPLTVEFPTRLNGSEYWDQSSLSAYTNGTNGITYNGVTEASEQNLYRVTLTLATVDALRINTVGINSDPADGATVQRGVGSRPGDGDDDPEGPPDEPALPDNAVAFTDQNNNDEFDTGEPSYTVADLAGLSNAGDLIVARDAIMDDGSLSGIDITSEKITVRDGLEMRTVAGGQSIQLTANTALAVDGATIHSEGGGAAITLEADGQLNAQAASISSAGGGSQIELRSGTELTADSAQVESLAPIDIEAGTSLSAQDASIMTQTGSGADLTISSDGGIRLADAIATGEDISLDSGGTIDLDRTRLTAASYGSLTAALTGNADLLVDNAEFRAEDDPTDLTYRPNSVTVIGTPAVGGTT